MKKILSLFLAITMVLSIACLFSSCSKDDTDYLIMATSAAFPPYEYKEGEDFCGIDIEIAGLIAKKLGKTLKIVDTQFGSIITGVVSGKYDIGMAGMTVTETRLQSVNFTVSYATGIQSIIVREDSDITCFADFFNADGTLKEGLKVGVQANTTGDIYLSSPIEKGGVGEENVLSFTYGADAVQALVTGKVDAVVNDNAPAKSYVERNSGLKLLDAEYIQEQYAICVAKENTELLDAINNALNELIADGSVQAIINKYIK